MPLDEPAWWYGSGAQAALMRNLLTPASLFYGATAKNRFRRSASFKAYVPVICVGNLTAGGTGKTPLAIHIAELLKGMGERPVFLSRGYGGRIEGSAWVELDKHSAEVAGDEPLLLARTAPVMISADRAAGARAIAADGGKSSIIIMDDGLQNPSLAKDLTLAVIDGARGIGNGRMIPAGPLRAPLKFQLGLVDAFVINGGQPEAAEAQIESYAGHTIEQPYLHARVVPQGDVSWLRDARVFAYAGIGHPQRFFMTLASLGAIVSGTAEFRDHQVPSPADAFELMRAARAKSAILVTTEKDIVRLPSEGHPNLKDLKAQSRTLPIGLEFSDDGEEAFKRLIATAISKRRDRK